MLIKVFSLSSFLDRFGTPVVFNNSPSEKCSTVKVNIIKSFFRFFIRYSKCAKTIGPFIRGKISADLPKTRLI